MSLAFLFPGQGAQRPGMGQTLHASFPESCAVYEEAADILSFDLAELCFRGPADKLTSTDIAQPAILATSVAALRALQARGLPAPRVCLGHSLGEYTALVAAGALTFAEGLRLVRKRGLFMREAGQRVGGAMAAVIGVDAEAVRACLEDVSAGRVLVAANYNTPEQTVISGEQSAVSDAVEELKSRLHARVVPLRVSGAFHSQLMQPAADKMAEELDAAEVRPAEVPVIANCSAGPVRSAEEIRAALKAQITSPVRWTESVARLRPMGCVGAVEIGAKDVLGGMARKIDPELQVVSVHDAESVEGYCGQAAASPHPCPLPRVEREGASDQRRTT